jgi:hypothetical protein
MVKGKLDLLSSFSLHDSGLWPQTSCLTTAFLKFVFSLCSVFFAFKSAFMPKLSLEQVKAKLIEEQRVRTERRISQLRQEVRRDELSEVLSICALLWIAVIVCFYARLYLKQQE